MNQPTRPAARVWTPATYFLSVLLIVFLAEVGVMCAIPLLLPSDVNSIFEAIVDATLLTLVCAPVLWWLLIGPLRELASDESQKYTAMMREARDGIMTLDEHGLVESTNASMSSLLRVDENQLIGGPISRVLPSIRGKSVNADLLKILVTNDSEGAHIRETITVADGTQIPVEVSISQLHLRGRTHYTLIVRDISQRVRAEIELADANQQLIETAHRAGKAEIATCVIHNVGNVLTNVNVLASAVTTKLRQSRLAGLGKAAQLINDHVADLSTYLSSDERGKQLPHYIVELSKCWDRERDDLLGNLSSLLDNLRHASKIIDAQQDFADAAGITEATSLPDLMDKALSISVAALERHSIQMTTEIEELPVVSIDRHKLLQVIVNLLTNAKEAFQGRPVDSRQISVRLTSHGPDRFRIEISDNGSGIPQDVLTKIFANGFTTKRDGHGFGLHYCSLAVREMGGYLSVQSAGVGHGATFSIDLPLELALTEALA